MSEQPKSPLQRAIDAVQGVGVLAAMIGVGQTAVSNWKSRSGFVPVEHCAAIERATQGAVRRWDLRPEDWHRVWPELIGAPGAPTLLGIESSTSPDGSGAASVMHDPSAGAGATQQEAQSHAA